MTPGADLIEHDQEMFFQIVQTTPDYLEALDLVDRARAVAVRKKNRASKECRVRDEKGWDEVLTRLNAEKKHINLVLNDMRWHESIRQALGKEALDAVVSYRTHTYQEGRRLDRCLTTNACKQ